MKEKKYWYESTFVTGLDFGLVIEIHGSGNKQNFPLQFFSSFRSAIENQIIFIKEITFNK